MLAVVERPQLIENITVEVPNTASISVIKQRYLVLCF